MDMGELDGKVRVLHQESLPISRIATGAHSRGGENTGITSPVYQINVYALDTKISAPAGSDREAVLRQIDGHVIAGGSVSTKYLSSIVIRK